MGSLFAALLALDEVAWVVLGGRNLLPAYLDFGSEFPIDRAARLALRGVPLYPVALLKLLLDHGSLLH